MNHRVIFGLLALFLSLTLMGCGAEKAQEADAIQTFAKTETEECAELPALSEEAESETFVVRKQRSLSGSNGMMKAERKFSDFAEAIAQDEWPVLELERMELPIPAAYIDAFCVNGDFAYFYAGISAGEEIFTDNLTGEEYAYDIYDNFLYRMDLQTHQCSIVDGYLPMEIPEGCEGGSCIQSIQAGEDGSIWLCEYMYSFRYILRETKDGKPLEGTEPVAEFEDGGVVYRMIHLGKDGESLGEYTYYLGSDPILNSPDIGINSILVGEDGRFYVTSWNKVWAIPLKGDSEVVEFTFEDHGGIAESCLYQGGVGVRTYDDGRFYALNVEDGTTHEVCRFPENEWLLQPGCGDYEFFYDNNGAVYGFSPESGAAELLRWEDYGIDPMLVSGFCALEDGGLLAVLWESNFDGERYSNETQLLLVHEAGSAAVPKN